MMFEGKLKQLPFKLSNAKSFLGAVFFQREKNPNDTWHYYGFVFKISKVMDLPEDVVEDTIIHEMIHYYIMSNQMQDTAPHGKLFIAKRDKTGSSTVICQSLIVPLKRNWIATRGFSSTSSVCRV